MVATPIARGPARWRLQRRYSGNGARTTVVMAKRHGHRAGAHSTSGRRPGINRNLSGARVAARQQRTGGMAVTGTVLWRRRQRHREGHLTVTGITLWQCLRLPGSWPATAATARPDQRQGGAGARATRRVTHQHPGRISFRWRYFSLSPGGRRRQRPWGGKSGVGGLRRRGTAAVLRIPKRALLPRAGMPIPRRISRGGAAAVEDRCGVCRMAQGRRGGNSAASRAPITAPLRPLIQCQWIRYLSGAPAGSAALATVPAAMAAAPARGALAAASRSLTAAPFLLPGRALLALTPNPVEGPARLGRAVMVFPGLEAAGVTAAPPAK